MKRDLRQVQSVRLSGTVRNVNGTGLVGAQVAVELQPTPAFLGSLKEGEAAAVIFLGTGTTRADGSFTLNVPVGLGVRPGYIDDDGLLSLSLIAGTSDLEGATEIVIAPRLLTEGSAKSALDDAASDAYEARKLEVPDLSSISITMDQLPVQDSPTQVGVQSVQPALHPVTGTCQVAPSSLLAGGPSGAWGYTGDTKKVYSAVQTLHTGWKAASNGASHTWTANKSQRVDAVVQYEWKRVQLMCMGSGYRTVWDARTRWFPNQHIGTRTDASRQPTWTCLPKYKSDISTNSVVSRDVQTTVEFSAGSTFKSSLSLGVRQKKTNSHVLTYKPSGNAKLCGRGDYWPRAREAKEVS